MQPALFDSNGYYSRSTRDRRRRRKHRKNTYIVQAVATVVAAVMRPAGLVVDAFAFRAVSIISSPSRPSSSATSHRHTSTAYHSLPSAGFSTALPSTTMFSAESPGLTNATENESQSNVSPRVARPRSTSPALAGPATAAVPALASKGRRPAVSSSDKEGSKDDGNISGDRSKAKIQAVVELSEELKRFGGLRMWRKALQRFNDAKKQGLPLKASTYTHVITAMSKGGRYKEATELLEEMIKAKERGDRAIKPTLIAYNSAITACARANKCQQAFDLLETMNARSGLSPDKYTYGAALLAVSKRGLADKAVDILKEMQANGVTPDPICHMLAMEACATRGAVEAAATILKEVREGEKPPDRDVMTQLLTLGIRVCARKGAWEQALDYLADIRLLRGGEMPRAPAYAAAANACITGGEIDRARSLILELAAGGGENNKPDLECYNTIVAGYSMSGDWERAVTTLKVDIPAAGLEPDNDGYATAIVGCGRAGKWESALALLNEQRSGKAPSAPANRESYNCALDACGRCGQVGPCLLILNAMRTAMKGGNMRLRPNTQSYAGALRACWLAADSTTALKLLAAMHREEVVANQRCLLSAVSACVASGRKVKAAELMESMVRDRVRTSEGGRRQMREVFEGTGEGMERCRAALDELARRVEEWNQDDGLPQGDEAEGSVEAGIIPP